MYKHFMNQINLKKPAAQQAIATHLEAIDRAVTPTESQQKKLSLAAKGSVKSHMVKESQTPIVKMAKQSGFDFVPGTPPRKPAATVSK